MTKMMLTLLFGLFVGSANAAEVYIDQAGSSTTIDITQTGSGNEITGDDGTTTAASVDGNSIDVDINQIGNNNTVEMNLDTAGTTTLDTDFTGDSNVFDIMVNGGTGGTHTVDVTGDSNDITICGTNAGGTISSSGTTVSGTSCSTGISANDVTNTITTYGDYNIVNVQQGSGVANSTNSVTIGTNLTDGLNNVVNIEQDNTEQNAVTLTIDGSDNAINIIQD